MAAAEWQTRTPDLVADVRLYAAAEGGRASAALPGYGCPCFASRDRRQGGWSARLQLDDQAFEPGTERRVGFVFLSPEGAELMKQAGRFYLWDARFIGEATVVG